MVSGKKEENGMTVGIDARLWNQTGVGRYTRNLVHNLLKIDEENTYVLFVRKQDYENIKYQISNIKYDNKLKIVPVSIPWHGVSEQLLFPRLIDRQNLDLMHFPYQIVPILYKRPYVVTIHDLILHHFMSGEASTLPLWLYGFKMLGYKFAINMTARNAKKIIAVSKSTKHEIMDHLRIDSGKIEVIYEAADDFETESEEKIDIKNYFLYVGNVYPHKNVRNLLRAFETLLKENKDLKLVFVGKEDFFYKKLKKQLRKMIENGSVIFIHDAMDKKLAALYKNAICLIRPSLMEGFSLPPLEAVTAGCLVLASNIPVHREIFSDSIIYFNPYDSKDIALKMKHVLSLPSKFKQDMIEKGVKRAKSFSWSMAAQQTLKVYESSACL